MPNANVKGDKMKIFSYHSTNICDANFVIVYNSVIV